MYACSPEIRRGFFAGVCAPSNASAHSYDPPLLPLDSRSTLRDTLSLTSDNTRVASVSLHPQIPSRVAATKRHGLAASSPQPLLPGRRSKRRGRYRYAAWQRRRNNRVIGSYLPVYFVHGRRRHRPRRGDGQPQGSRTAHQGNPEPHALTGYDRRRNHRDLLTRLSTALALTEVAYLEARRRSDL